MSFCFSHQFPEPTMLTVFLSMSVSRSLKHLCVFGALNFFGDPQLYFVTSRASVIFPSSAEKTREVTIYCRCLVPEPVEVCRTKYVIVLTHAQITTRRHNKNKRRHKTGKVNFVIISRLVCIRQMLEDGINVFGNLSYLADIFII